MIKLGKAHRIGCIIIYDLIIIFIFVSLIGLSLQGVYYSVRYLDPTGGYLSVITAILFYIFVAPVLVYCLIGNTVFNPYHLKKLIAMHEEPNLSDVKEGTQQGNTAGTP